MEVHTGASKAPRANQHKPTPPRLELDTYIKKYWLLGFSDPKIAEHVLDHFDRKQYGLSAKTVQRSRQRLGLKGTIQQAADFDTIMEIYKVIRSRFPSMGARRMVSVIRQDYQIKVSESLVNQFLKTIEPEAVESRRTGKSQRRHFYSAGVMEIWSIDQHDKWKRFGLWLHQGVDPFSGRIAWIRVWWCNRNPRLIMSYYLDAAREVGGIPLITMSDRGTENYGVANLHTTIRHQLDSTLSGTLQHRFCVKPDNIKSENTWSMFQRQFTPGFQTVFESGTIAGLYDPDNPLENLVFRWLAIPWLQAEINKWVNLFNTTPRRANKNKILPQGIPNIIHEKPSRFDSRDFKIIVAPSKLDQWQAEWAPLGDPVHQVTPVAFYNQASHYYKQIGCPPVSNGTFWNIFTSLLTQFHMAQDLDESHYLDDFYLANSSAEESMHLLQGERELQHGDAVIGDHIFYEHYAEFTDEEDVEEDVEEF